MTFHSDYKNLLVSETDILPKLKDAGIFLPAKLAKKTLELDRRESWQEIHSSRNVFTAAEAVRAICGIDPSYTWALSESDDQRYDRYMSVLVDAVRYGELLNKVKNPSGAPYEWEIAHSDIYSWCEGNNIPWPFPKPVAPTVSNNLSKELEREQAKCQEIETAEQSRHRAAELEGLRLQLEQERTARQAAEQRAKRAETEATALRLQLAAAGTADQGSGGLTFPYATKELEAMRAAVAKYWEGYTTDKRQPTQKEVAIELGELLGLSLMKNKEPARKAVNLAAAIKPVDLPDA
ncbi:hypothetical protein [Azotobacter beijerinckii]|nr:hypothetical protein [Azotobacter beijerinckii]